MSLLDLPPELIAQDVLRRLSLSDLVSCAKTCKFLHQIILDEHVWKRLCLPFVSVPSSPAVASSSSRTFSSNVLLQDLLDRQNLAHPLFISASPSLRRSSSFPSSSSSSSLSSSGPREETAFEKKRFSWIYRNVLHNWQHLLRRKLWQVVGSSHTRLHRDPKGSLVLVHSPFCTEGPALSDFQIPLVFSKRSVFHSPHVQDVDDKHHQAISDFEKHSLATGYLVNPKSNLRFSVASARMTDGEAKLVPLFHLLCFDRSTNALVPLQQLVESCDPDAVEVRMVWRRSHIAKRSGLAADQHEFPRSDDEEDAEQDSEMKQTFSLEDLKEVDKGFVLCDPAVIVENKGLDPLFSSLDDGGEPLGSGRSLPPCEFRIRVQSPFEFLFYPLPIPSPSSKSFEGLFVGRYGPHGSEIISLHRTKDLMGLVGKKITGDPNVFCGTQTFLFSLRDRWTEHEPIQVEDAPVVPEKSLVGVARIAGTDMRNDQWSLAIIVRWRSTAGKSLSNFFTVTWVDLSSSTNFVRLL